MINERLSHMAEDFAEKVWLLLKEEASLEVANSVNLSVEFFNNQATICISDGEYCDIYAIDCSDFEDN